VRVQLRFDQHHMLQPEMRHSRFQANPLSYRGHIARQEVIGTVFNKTVRHVITSGELPNLFDALLAPRERRTEREQYDREREVSTCCRLNGSHKVSVKLRRSVGRHEAFELGEPVLYKDDLLRSASCRLRCYLEHQEAFAVG